jgi:hypothetical protein
LRVAMLIRLVTFRLLPPAHPAGSKLREATGQLR